VYAKDIKNIFSKIITESFPNLKKEMVNQVKEAFRTPNRHDQERTSLHHITVKTLGIQNK
jgi:hypothetical protein